MKYFHKKVWLGFFSAIAIISWLGVNSFINNRKSSHSAQWVAHTNRVLYHSEQILALTVDLESGQRGYALTGKEAFLAPTKDASPLLLDHLRSLKELTSDNASQQVRIKHLERLIRSKLAFSNKAIQIRRDEGVEPAMRLNATMEGKVLMDSIRTFIKQFQEEEHQLFTERTALITKRIEAFNASFTLMLLATAVIIMLVFYMVFINLKRRTQAEESLRTAAATIQDMYDNAPCGYHSINDKGIFVEINSTWLQWLKYSREEVVGKMHFEQILTPEGVPVFRSHFKDFQRDGKIRDVSFEVMRKDGTTFTILLNSIAIYDESGKFLKSRSTVLDYTDQKKSLEKIEQLNHELESFSYSVSHDLRAPLRSIDGYTQILLEDYADKLDDEGKRVLKVVVNNARRMANLIDDLLDFSRIGRKELSKSVVNAENMVNSVVSELRSQEPDRQFEVTVHPLDPCDGDPNLLRQVWVNLISNAFKYTRKREKTIVEISSQKTPSEVIYKITDNGTGFDMQYSHKLFGVFQRLHRQQDFEGTGVGLAIVHRIITRHGGRVWAEGEIDKGASFFFSLPNSIA